MKYNLASNCLVAFALILTVINISNAQSRKIEQFNDDWHFKGLSASGQSIEKAITLPHTWNAIDAQEGIAYYRGKGTYQKSFASEESWKNKRVFLRFEGVNITSTTSLNGQILGEHKGGYAAFCYEITDYIHWDGINDLQVDVSNEANLEVLPLVGDFNNYGGIYRPVKLIVTDQICISPLDFASPGVYLTQREVTREKAEVEVKTLISSKGDKASVELRTTLQDREGNLLETISRDMEIIEEHSEIKNEIIIDNPHLWQGRKDPYLYYVRVELIKNGRVIDEITEPLGLRYFHIDSDKGFFLNDAHIPLHGVSRHQDRVNMGSAITDKEHREDMDIMLDMGINALRLAHYQHAEIVYDLADSAGLIVWAELPWVGMPAGFIASSNGYENTPEFHANARQQLTELIRQNYNHPSIVMWSIFNEIQNPKGSEPTALIEELNQLAKTEDPTRMTVGASMLAPESVNNNIHEVTDAIAWNRYFGWYYKLPEDMATFLDELHASYPDYKIGISEYGAGGSVRQHSEELVPPNPMGSPHPEEWQSYYHEEHLKIYNYRPFVWGTFIWNMFDFGSYFRREGDHFGINDKGMVTYDRKTRKDAFYFYKANWSDEPVLHIASKKFIFRDNSTTNVKVYTNLDNIELKINGKSLGIKSPETGIALWEDVALIPGNNGIIVTASKDGINYTDDCVWVYENPFSGMRLMIKVFDFLPGATTYGIIGLILGIILWALGSGKNTGKFKKFGFRFMSILVIIASFLIIIAKIVITNALA